MVNSALSNRSAFGGAPLAIAIYAIGLSIGDRHHQDMDWKEKCDRVWDVAGEIGSAIAVLWNSCRVGK